MTHKPWLLTAGLLAGVMSGCNGEVTPQARQTLQSGYAAYNRGDDKAAVGFMDTFLLDNDRTGRAAEAYYIRGLARYRMKDLGGARADLSGVLDKSDDKSLRVESLAALGEIACQSNDPTRAEAMFRQAIAEGPRGAKPLERAHYRLGCLLQQQGRWADADEQFSRVTFLYKDGEMARDAALRQHCAAWTIECGRYADKPSADAAAGELVRNKLQAVCQAMSAASGPVFCVQVGRYATQGQAATDLANVKRFKTDAFVTTTR